ncbi:uncharacterized protein LOC118181468 [Stegodyphus dumicola]|uniref:uncharacterized protein LOC118181468 n=1 Tax=Stegodyphus dumicola TaxID=202533 RepID=UPI0015A93EA8|nr:uncharacterized protein LOC118181468 [Stegodyphus dumicola]
MNILHPQLVWIEDRCYRKLPIRNVEKKSEDVVVSKIAIEDEDDDYNNLGIKFLKSRFLVTISVPNPLMKFVIGRHNKTISSIEQQTGAQLKVLNRKAERQTSEIGKLCTAIYY